MNILSALLKITSSAEGALQVSYEKCVAGNLALRLRVQELRKRIQTHLKRLGTVSCSEAQHHLTLQLASPDRLEIQKAVANLDAAIQKLAVRPLTAKEVEQALGISVKERLRWTKDKRLPRSGTTTIRRGQVIGLATYPVQEISDLAASPDILAGWRREDARATQKA